MGVRFERSSTATCSGWSTATSTEATVGHFRAYGGEPEVNLVAKGRSGRVVAIEVKFAATPSERDGRHLNWLEREIGDELLDKVIVTTGANAYRREDGIAIVPAALLGP